MNYTRKHILSLLHDYSDVEKQRYEWTTNLQKTYFTPTELIEEWFSDIFQQKPEAVVMRGEITQAEWETIKPFYDNFRLFADYFHKNENNLPADLTLDDGWRKIIQSSAETLKKLESIGWTHES